MADLSRLQEALINADKAGDTAAAQAFAGEIRRLQSAQQFTTPIGELPPLSTTAQQPGNLAFGITPNLRVDTNIKTPVAVNNALAGAGKAFTDVARGAGQLIPLPGGQMMVSGRDVEESQRLDQPLMDTKAGFGGNLAGNVALTAGVPIGNSFKTAAAIGGTLGLLQPVASDDVLSPKRAVNILTGLGGGVAGQGLAFGLGRANRPAVSGLTPEEARLSNLLRREGVPMEIGTELGSPGLKLLESVLAKFPLTARKAEAGRQATSEAFNAAVLKRAGINNNNAAPDVIRDAFTEKGALFEALANGKQISMDANKPGAAQDLLARLVDLEGKTAPVRNILDTGPIDRLIYGTFDMIAKGRPIDGTTAQAIRSDLTKEIRAKSASGDARIADALRAVRDGFDNAIYETLTPAEKQTWDTVKREYSNLKIIDKAMTGSKNDTLRGNISPTALSQAVRQADPTRYARSMGDLNDLSRAGALFVRDSIPDSGTSQRGWLTNLLTGGGIGAGAYAGFADPLLTTTAVGSAVAIPKVTQAFLRSEMGKNYLRNGLIANSPNRQAVIEGLRRLAITGGAGLPLSLRAGSVPNLPQ